MLPLKPSFMTKMLSWVAVKYAFHLLAEGSKPSETSPTTGPKLFAVSFLESAPQEPMRCHHHRPLRIDGVYGYIDLCGRKCIWISAE